MEYTGGTVANQNLKPETPVYLLQPQQSHMSLKAYVRPHLLFYPVLLILMWISFPINSRMSAQLQPFRLSLLYICSPIADFLISNNFEKSGRTVPNRIFSHTVKGALGGKTGVGESRKDPL